MHLLKLLHKQLSLSCPHIHSTRLNSLISSVNNLLNGKQLTLTALGRACYSDSAQVKNKIKQMDRLLGNKHLHNEIDDIYQSIAKILIKNKEHPIILVDWSSVDLRNKFQVLKATLAHQGRGITICDHIEYTNRKRNDQYNSLDKLLKKLNKILPRNCKPIIITDAGFSVKWFRRIEKAGWYWIGRLRGRVKVCKTEENKWLNCQTVFQKATGTPKTLGDFLVAKKSPLGCKLFLYKKPKKGRIRKNRNGEKKARSKKNDYERASYEPWLLASNLPSDPNIKKKVIKYYGLRMQIEETFRDIKDLRYGFGLNTTLTNCKKRIGVLMLIGSLGLFVLGILGKAGYKLGLNRKFQSNTVRTTFVLSLCYLGSIRPMNYILFKNLRLCKVISFKSMRGDFYAPSLFF